MTVCFSILTSGPHLDATIISENVLRRSHIDAIIFNCGPLICFSCFRRLFQLVHDSAFNQTFKFSFIVVFIRMFHNKKIFRRCSIKYRTFHKVQRDVIYLAYVFKEWKAAVNYPKIVAYAIKIVKFLVCIISEHPLKAISLIFETKTVGTSLVQKLKWKGCEGWTRALWLPSGYVLHMLNFQKMYMLILIPKVF